MKNKIFYGKFSSGASFKDMQSNYYSKKNISYVSKIIKINLRKMEISKNDLKNKVIMNVGSGRECVGLMQFNPKKIYHYDLSEINIKRFKNFIVKNNLENKIISNQFDISKNKLPKDKFDFIYLHGIIQHVNHVNQAVENLCLSMKLNGRMWFYFYRPGSFNVFLGSIQRYLLRNIKIETFNQYLKKNIKDNNFIDGIMDDCYAPNRQLFYPKDYHKFLENNGCDIYESSFLKSYYPEVDFLNYHESVVFFIKKKLKKKLYKNTKILKRGKDVNVLNRKLYHDKNILYILSCLKKLNKKNFTQIFNIIIKIEKIKQQIAKKILKNKKLNKTEYNEIMKKIKKII